MQGFVKTLGGDSWICEDSQDFGRGFVRLWERIHVNL